MIHPINIPDDLLAVNPTRPQLIVPRRKAKISYSNSGRKFHEGEPLSPKTPVDMWNDFFLRTFVHRVACNAIDSNDKCSLDSLIDIIDFQESGREKSQQGEKFDSSASVTIEIVGEDNSSKKKLAPTTSLQTDRVEIVDDEGEEEAAGGDDFEKELDALERRLEGMTRMGSGARSSLAAPKLQLRRGSSMRVRREAFKSIMDSCCAISDVDGRPKFKEFARLDFSHSNFLHMSSVVATGEQAVRKGSVTMVPSNVGSRLWTSEKKKAERGDELLFVLRKVHFGRGGLDIQLSAHNPSGKAINFEIEQHLHEASMEQIGKLIEKSRRTHILNMVDSSIEAHVDISEEVERVFTDPSKYLIVTLHGGLS